MTFDLSSNVLAVGIGDEWKPNNPGEREMVVCALTKYYETKQMEDLPPNVALAVVVCAYSLPRLAHQNTRNKLSLAWVWLKLKLKGFFRR